MEKKFTHLNESGRARMVDVTEKNATHRVAVARGRVRTSPESLNMIKNQGMKKGDVLGIAQVAGVMGAKKTSEIIPLCHPLILTGIDLNFEIDEEEGIIDIEAEVKVTGQTGVEMEALTAVTTAALTIYDMCKAVDKGMVIEEIYLYKKSGGKSGDYFSGK
ncbi:MAG: cyclic pyranopterin monophosphate synthase MoaC [Halanaerobiales bacterium]|nr:cyclic pyranopterin monophosphate synthase MoaC [Halanaerobiales bacterium]